ncbi:hypothetical protein COU56_02350 [Candidatus Pacearchaeota archaeon CG10_big_fil_rev_8_21_14_0_10_31_9]|nr:MAG: hypothetical protein AUJ62_01505 [Candidatus Pacearchaeota archaeon CG1_02_32_21]PIN94855.1 MAG: hypothetical protein COU56_02350 [Candidatus Pacearchaeota archaeon CG10_big_fil_rev_8_21_14_0_10_31_9]PIZ82854.1 MAG: hypothetical protein COX97_02770 [Candidatus Pacearchaeota archaeon CG_4_10_14_0_2_um_filter_05_32_18]
MKINNCVFCDIHKLNNIFISENKNCFSILSNPSLTYGHSLVIPKRHIEKINELKEEEIISIFSEIIKLQEIILKKFKGCDIRQNYRPFIKDDYYKVSHLHFHLIPRKNEDELYQKSMIHEKTIFKFLHSEELNSIKEDIYGPTN